MPAPAAQEKSIDEAPSKPAGLRPWASRASDGATSPLTVRGLSVAYDRKPVLTDASFAVRPGTLTAIVGPNGAGKSTLLKASLGLLPATGEVRFWGSPLKAVRGRVGYVPQRAAVDWEFPVTAGQVVAMGLYSKIGWFRPVTRKWRAVALAALDRVGLADVAERQIGQLSGGQQQRVFLARALAQDADLYLMDEPLAGIDAVTEEVIFGLLGECRSAGRTAVVVHHDLDTVPTAFDDVILLNRRVVAVGPVAEIFTATNLKSAYGGKIAVLDRAAV